MNSYILYGGSEEEKNQAVAKLVKKFAISPFDQYLIQPEKSLGIETIRDIIHLTNITPYQGNYKAIIIRDFDKITLQAENAILKTLEEPPSYNLIILLTNNLEVLLPTIISRCQIIRLGDNHTAQNENYDSYLVSLNDILSKSPGQIINLLEKINKENEEISIFLKNSILALRTHYFMRLDKSRQNIKINNLKNLSLTEIVQLIRKFQEAAKIIEKNVNPRLVLEVLFISISGTYSLKRTLI